MSEKKNSFFNIFSKLVTNKKKEELKTVEKNAIGSSISQDQLTDMLYNIFVEENKTGGEPFEKHTQVLDFTGTFSTKKQKIAKYQEMSLYPEISFATENIVNDAIIEDENEQVCNIILKEPIHKKMPSAVKKAYLKCFDKVINQIYNFNDEGDVLFEKFLIEGELYVEFILNKEKDDIISYQILPTYTMLPVYNKANNEIIRFIQFDEIMMNVKKINEFNTPVGKQEKETKSFKEFAPNQVAYANSGKYGKSIYDVRSYYDTIIKTYHHIKTIDDALAIYRWSRAPETRVWNIYTGKMNPKKAQNFLRNVVTKYRKKNEYNFNTGEINQQANIKNIIEDLWFTKDESGNETRVDTLRGGMQLGELGDVEYYIKKLYTGLKIPRGRWDDQDRGEWQATMDRMARDEIRFANMIRKFHRKFKEIIVSPIETLMKASGIDEEWIDRKYFDIKFTQSNKWKFYLDNELWNQKIRRVSDAKRDHVYDPRDNPNGWLPMDYLLKTIFNDEELETMKKMLDEAKMKHHLELAGEKVIVSRDGENIMIPADQVIEGDEVIVDSETLKGGGDDDRGGGRRY